MAAEGSNVQHIAELSVDLSPAYKALEEFGTRVSEASVTISQMFQNGWNIQSTLADVSNNGGDAQQRLAAEALKANEELKKQLSIITQNAQRTDTLTGSLAKLVGGYKALQLGKKALSEIYDTMKTVESSMVDIKRVMELTGEETTALRDTLFSTAQAFGSTFDQAAGVTLKFAQAGYDAADAAKATEAALLAMNTAELDLNSATTGLISILAQWGFEASELVGIIDKLNYTADNNAVTTQNLVDGLAASSAVAKAAGVEFNELVAILTVMSETSGRTGKEVGNAFKSILSYIQRDKSLEWFDAHGIEVFADEAKNALLPMTKILENMAEAWAGFTTAQQDAMVQQAEDAGLLSAELAQVTGSMAEYEQYIEATAAATDMLNTAEARSLAQQAAGTYRRSLYIALLENFSDVAKISAEMLDAEGHSMRENADRMETLETKTNQLITALQELAVQAGDAGLLDIAKWAVEAATAIANFTKSLGGLQPVLLTITGLWMALNQQKAAKIFDMTGVTGAVKALKSFADNLRILYYESQTAGGGMKGFSAAMQLAGAEAKVAGGNIASAFAGLGVTGWIGIAVAAIGAVVMAVKAYNEHIQKTIDQANEAKEAYEQLAKAGQDNISTLKGMEKEFEQLSKGVSEYGENISLSADEYDRYKEIMAKVLEMHPSLIQGYDEEGRAFSYRNDLLSEAIELQKEYNKLQRTEYLEDAKKHLKGFRNELKQAQEELQSAVLSLLLPTPQGMDEAADTIFKGVLEKAGLNNTFEEDWTHAPLAFAQVIMENTALMEEMYEKRANIIEQARAVYGDEQASELSRALDTLGLYTSKVDEAQQKIRDLVLTSVMDESWYAEIPTQYLEDFGRKVQEIASDGSKSMNQLTTAASVMGYAFQQALAGMPLDRIEELKRQLSEGALSIDDFRSEVAKIAADLQGASDGTDTYAYAMEAVISNANDFADAQERMAGAVEDGAGRIVSLTNQFEELQAALAETVGKMSDLESAYNTLYKANEELAEAGSLTAATFDTLINNDLLKYLEMTEQGLWFNVDALEADFEALKADAIATATAAANKEILALAENYAATEAENAKAPIENVGNAAKQAGQDAAEGAQGLIDFAVAAASISDSANLEAFAAEYEQIADRLKATVAGINSLSITTTADRSRETAARKAETEAIKAQTDAINENIKALQKEQKAADKNYSNQIDALKKLQKAATDSANARIKALQKEQKAVNDSYNKRIKAAQEELKQIQKSYNAQMEAVRNRYNAEIEALRKLKQEENRQDAREDYERSRAELLAERAEMEKRTSREAVERIKEIDKALEDLDRQEERRLRDNSIDDQIDRIETVRDAELDAIQKRLEAEQERYERRIANLQEEQQRAQESYARQIEAAQNAAEAVKNSYAAQIEAIQEKQKQEKEATEEKIELLREEIEAVKKGTTANIQSTQAVGQATTEMTTEAEKQFHWLYEQATKHGQQWAYDAIRAGQDVYRQYAELAALMNSLFSGPSNVNKNPLTGGYPGSGYRSSHTGSLITGDGLVNLQAGELVVRRDISEGLMRNVKLMDQIYNNYNNAVANNQNYSRTNNLSVNMYGQQSPTTRREARLTGEEMGKELLRQVNRYPSSRPKVL